MITAKIGELIHKDFETISLYAGVNLIKEKLIHHSALVVKDEETGDFKGILTPVDIVKKPHNLVADCLTDIPLIDSNCKLEKALGFMYDCNTEVLPVSTENVFKGLLFKDDLIAFISLLNARQGEELLNNNLKIEQSEKVLNALYNSTNSVRFLVAPDYTILFFNKKAYENSISLHGRELKIGDNLLDYARDASVQTIDNLDSDFKASLNGKYVVKEDKIDYEKTSLWVKTEYHPVYLQDQIIGISININDITDRKMDEIHITKQNKVLKDIIAFQSHEVRRPVASMLGLIKLIDRKNLSSENQKIFEMLEKTTGELDDIVRTIVRKAHKWKSS